MVVLYPPAYAGLPILGDIELASPSAVRHDQIKTLVLLPAGALAAGLPTDPLPKQQAAPQDGLLAQQLSQLGSDVPFPYRHRGPGNGAVLV